ncbi:sulfite exporter TauE/SafE family protein [Rubritalea marina]|uniref:sulfite exporter TauE/SafE family protein n=1 Tax=Rubritalea marina TaxID=361055 RepID=UPI001969BB7C|nr:sulfite exporter TauE/SafE family protein [Rubritalea marina]
MSSIAALSAGIATSLHCVGMCGPLACSVTSRAKNRDHALLETLLYHTGRITSYTLIGGLAGAIGHQPLSYFFHSPAVILPWLMIPFLIITAFPNIIKIPQLRFLARPYYKAKIWAQDKPPGVAGGLLGLISPCLPCTPLYLIFGVSLLSGSALTGAQLALCFSLGTVPLLWAAQSSTHVLTKWIPGPWRNRLRKSFLVVITVMLAIRLQGTLPFITDAQAENKPAAEQSEQSTTITREIDRTKLPSCCPDSGSAR